MDTRTRLAMAAGVCLGGLTSAAPVAAQISTAGNLLLQQGVGGLQDLHEAVDRFGRALAWGDFDGDGFGDLAIGVPFEDLALVNDGVVHVVYGDPAGLNTDPDDLFFRAMIAGAGTTHLGDRMGAALTAGDFDGDGFDDLAISLTGDMVNDQPQAGSVVVLYGSSSGLDATDAQLWNQASVGVLESAEAGDSFGSVLTAGDFDGDGFDDLVIGVPLEDLGGEQGAGFVHVLKGSAGGLAAGGNLGISRGQFGGPGPAGGDSFGAALAAGDLDGDGFDDLAIGAPGVDRVVIDAGEVFALFGGPGGLNPGSPNSRMSIDRGLVRCRPGGTADGTDPGDRFGATLAIADFDGDGDAELVVGIPGAMIDNQDGAGQIDVIYPGTPIFGDDAGCWNQGVPGVGGGLPFAGEHFGASLAAGDLTGDGVEDLVVGVPDEAAASGGFHVFHGDPAGLAPAATPFWSQDTLGVPDTSETADSFGFALALGDANGDGFADLAVGVPGEEIDNTQPDHGAIHVFYNGNRIFADGFESGDLSAWSNQP